MYGMTKKQIFVRGFCYTLSAVCIAIAGYAMYIVINDYLVPPKPLATFNTTSELSPEERLAADAAAASLSGKLYYSAELAIPADDTVTPSVSISAFDWFTNETEAVTTRAFNSQYAPLSDGSVVTFALTDEDPNNPEMIHMIRWFPAEDRFKYVAAPPGFSESSVTAETEGRLVAYTMQPALVEESASFDINDWQVVIFDAIDERIVKVIDNATAPAWLNGSEDLLYVTDNAIKRYSLTADAHEIVVDDITGFTSAASLAVSPEKNYAVLTTGVDSSLFTFAIQNSDNAVMQLQSFTQDGDRVYRNAVPSPDAIHYAHVALDLEGATVTKTQVLVRRYDTGEVVRVIDLVEQETFMPTQLHYWSNL